MIYKLKFINFGLKIPTSLSSFVLNPNLWPKDITVKPFKFSTLTDSNNISIYYQNVGGLRSKLNEFFIVSQEDYSVITLTETWLHSHISDAELFNGNYQIYRVEVF